MSQGMFKCSRRLIGGIAATVLLGALVGVTPAFAEMPWWHLTSSARPSYLQAGQAKDEVQEVTVSATGGLFVLIEMAQFKDEFFAWDATHGEVQAGLEKIYGAGNVEVSGGPGDGSGTKPYVITFTGELADQPVAPINSEFSSAFLEGGGKEARTKEVGRGRPDGEIVVTAADLGNASVDGTSVPVTIADKLPSGLRAVEIEGVAGEILFNDNPGPVTCSLKSLSCMFSGSLPYYDSIEVSIGVVVEPAAKSGRANEVSVSGGNAQAATVTHPVAIGAPPPSGVEDYELTPEEEGGSLDRQAGSHPFQLTTTIMLNQTSQGGHDDAKPVELAKDLHFKLPPGLIGNPTPFPQCTLAQFDDNFAGRNACSPKTVVGVARVGIKLYESSEAVVPIATPLFNLEPAVGEPARFAFEAQGTPVFLDTAVRTGGDYGVTVNVNNISQTVDFIDSEVTFWGVPGDTRHDNARGFDCLSAPRSESSRLEHPCALLGESTPPPLLTLPTSCTGPLQSTVETDSWKQPGSFSTFATTEPMVGLDGCNRLPFSPSISVAPDAQAGSTPTGLTVGVHVPQEAGLDGKGLAEADVKDTTVTLPAGVALNPAAADGLLACSEGQVTLDSDSAASCPEASKVGTVEITSPLVADPIVGAVYLAAQGANPFGSLVALYIVAEDPTAGFLLKIAGEVKLDPLTGQLVSSFKGTPQLPFEDLKLHFFGGSRAPLSTPASCGPYVTGASIAPWSGGAPAGPSSEFRITSGPNGSSCASPLPFNPSLTAGATNIQAGAFSPFTMTMSREDGQQSLDAVQLHMPPGLLGTLSRVKLCGEAEADAGTCGAESLIGETTVSVGLGGDPFSVRGGRVYITGPYRGAPFGLSIVNPAKAGPYDLGQVIVRAKIEVDPITSALTITTDASGPYAIPQILDGIPLQIKHVNVRIDRPGGFTFNPTNCAPKGITGGLTSGEGATSALAVPFQVTNCATLAFKPQFKVSSAGKTSRTRGASLHVKLTYPKAAWGTQANVKSVKVDLPKQLPSQLKTLQRACPDYTFKANPAGCDPESRIGTARATTPLLPVPLTGPVYFVSHAGLEFPELVIVLSGYGAVVQLHAETFINSRTNITSSTFRAIPDVPVGTFELTLPQGKFPALAAPNNNLCKEKLTMPTAFTAQNGAAVKQSTPISVTGCAKHKRAKSKRKKR